MIDTIGFIKTTGSSAGAQEKIYRDGVWYKKDMHGYEGLAEELCSEILSCSNVDNYVIYTRCDVAGRPGCKSNDFTGKDEIFLSFQRIYNTAFGGELEGKINVMDSPKERIDYTVSMIKNETGIDVSRYISDTLSFDMLTLNTDRHMNNLGVIANTVTGKYRLAPIFDNGAALLSDYVMFPPDIDINNINVCGRPFSSNLELQAATGGITLKLDYDRLNEKLQAYNDSRALKVLGVQLNKYKDILKK